MAGLFDLAGNVSDRFVPTPPYELRINANVELATTSFEKGDLAHVYTSTV